MKRTLALVALVAIIAGCQTPGNTGGYVIVNEPDSRATISIGGNGSQTVGMHSPVPAATANGETTADATGAKAAGVFSNANTGSRSAALDATTAIETLRHVKSSTAGMTQGRDQSPNTATQTPSTTDTDSHAVSVPVEVRR